VTAADYLAAHPTADPFDIIASAVTVEEKRSRVREVFATLATHTRTEPGCLSFMVLESFDEPRFTTVERWANSDAMFTHLHSPHVEAFRQAIEAFYAGTPRLIAGRSVA
jgi:quinol monooxygenase YgiN